MKRFLFPLERVLAWRRTQADIEQAKLQRLFAKLKALEDKAEALELELEAAERKLISDIGRQGSVNATELVQLGGYRLHVKREVVRLGAEQQQVRLGVNAQRAVLIAARRKCRLLERLRQKAQGEWEREYNRELEALAGELHLARWKPSSEVA